MADFTDANYGLDEEDKALVDSIGATPDTNALQQPAADVPDGLLDDGRPEPAMEGPQLDQSNLPSGVLDDIAATPSPAPVEAPKGPATAEDTIRRQGEQEQKQAKIAEDVAAQQSEAAKQHNMDMRLAYADYLERRQRAEQDLDRRVKELDSAKIEDPRKADPHKNRIAVIFGALGAGFAGGSNQNLEALQKKWHDQTEIQKANIGLMQDRVALARTNLKDVDDAKAKLRAEADAQLISNYNAAIKQGELQLKKLGVPAAEIATDERLQKLQAGKAAAVALARKQNDEHELAQARIRLMQAQAGKAARKGGGGGSAAAEAELTKLAESGATLGAITDRAAQLKIPKAGDVARKIKGAVDLARGRDSKDNEGDSKNEVFNPQTGETYGNAPTPARAAKATEDLKLIQGLRKDMLDLKRHLNDPKTKGPVAPFGMSEAARERDSLTKSAIVKLSAFNNLGAISADDRRLLESIVNGGVSSLLGLSNKQIDSILDKIDQGQQTVLNVHGLNKVGGKRESASDPKLDEAKKIMADPGSYSPKARAAAAAYLKSKLQ